MDKFVSHVLDMMTGQTVVVDCLRSVTDSWLKFYIYTDHELVYVAKTVAAVRFFFFFKLVKQEEIGVI